MIEDEGGTPDDKCKSTGKKKFYNEHEARIFARSRMHGARIRVYKCTGKNGCGRLHITRGRVNGD